MHFLTNTAAWQENIQLPLLYRVATWSPMEFHRGDIPELLTEPLGRLYNLADREWSEINAGGVFYRIVMHGKWKLKDKKLVHIEPRERWTVTDKGFEWLQRYCARAIAKLDEQDRTNFLSERDENSQDLLLNALKRLDDDSLAHVVCESSSYDDMMWRAVAELPLEEVAGFLTSAHHMWHLLLKNHIGGFRRPTEQTPSWPPAVIGA